MFKHESQCKRLIILPDNRLLYCLLFEEVTCSEVPKIPVQKGISKRLDFNSLDVFQQDFCRFDMSHTTVMILKNLAIGISSCSLQLVPRVCNGLEGGEVCPR